jgi:arylsulfatase A-like enzyme
MTGLMPHNHNATTVHQPTEGTGDWGGTPPDEAALRPDKRHWAQQLVRDGYVTGYFGKWHIDYWHNVNRYGWITNDLGVKRLEPLNKVDQAFAVDHPRKGYGKMGGGQIVTDPPEERGDGLSVNEAERFLDWVMPSGKPWCCFLSFVGPHSAKICSQETFESYDLEDMDLPPSLDHDLKDRPELFQLARESWKNMTERDHRRARAAYYASIEDQDKLFGRLMDKLEAAGELDNTIIIYCSDHGEALGCHGVYTKLYFTHEAAFNIPLVMCGPGIEKRGEVSDAKVGLQDLCPTLLDLADAPPIDNPIDGASFAPLLRGEGSDSDHTKGYGQIYGTQYFYTSRLYWEGDWKLALNTFGKSELYNLKEDPHEMKNLAYDAEYADVLERMARGLFAEAERTDDRAFKRGGAPLMRLLPIGQGIMES